MVRTFHAIAFISVLSLIPVLQYVLPNPNVDYYGITHYVMQMCEYYSIVGLSYWYKKEHTLMSDKIRYIQKRLATKNNKQKTYLTAVIIWFTLTICFYVFMYITLFIYPEDPMWMLLLLNSWYIVIMFNHNNHIATCVINYFHISDFLLCMNENVEDNTRYYQKDDKDAQIDKQRDRDMCMKIDNMINLYEDICDYAEMSNKIFGFTVSVIEY